RSAISEIERGNRKVDSLELRKLARVYGYPVSYFLGDSSEQTWPTEALGRVLTELTVEDHSEILKFAEFLSYNRQTRKQ
ncbi:helix-turn-helix transcriptional regulator, partial [Klebsiella pneumoniae]|uniref:helix-turn-helix domain-containing protein n=1 Tax=Klebsiella pneumoniae TaxID=573 RepID=UPI002731693D